MFKACAVTNAYIDAFVGNVVALVKVVVACDVVVHIAYAVDINKDINKFQSLVGLCTSM